MHFKDTSCILIFIILDAGPKLNENLIVQYWCRLKAEVFNFCLLDEKSQKGALFIIFKAVSSWGQTAATCYYIKLIREYFIHSSHYHLISNIFQVSSEHKKGHYYEKWVFSFCGIRFKGQVKGLIQFLSTSSAISDAEISKWIYFYTWLGP